MWNLTSLKTFFCIHLYTIYCTKEITREDLKKEEKKKLFITWCWLLCKYNIFTIKVLYCYDPKCLPLLPLRHTCALGPLQVEPVCTPPVRPPLFCILTLLTPTITFLQPQFMCCRDRRGLYVSIRLDQVIDYYRNNFLLYQTREGLQ